MLGVEEDGKSLEQRTVQVQKELHVLDEAIKRISLDGETDITSMESSENNRLHETLHKTLICLDHYANSARSIREKKEYALKKFTERSRPNWRTVSLFML